jgi:hypothetical protein
MKKFWLKQQQQQQRQLQQQGSQQLLKHLQVSRNWL